MSGTITLIIAGTECTLPAEELTIERIIAEAHSLGYQQFSVFCNDKEIKNPANFKVVPGATYIIASPDDTLNPKDIIYQEIEEENVPY
ncbi:MAG: hypothetical protein R3D86_06050 [Emcibacteraceae bacterium]